MVVHPLQQVAHQLGVEERHGQFQQFDEEVRHQRDIYPHTDVQQYPPTYEVHACPTDGQHQLSDKYQIDEIQVPVLDSYVHNGLRQEGEDELQDTANQ